MDGSHTLNTQMLFRIMSNWSELPIEFRQEYKIKKTIKSPKKQLDAIVSHMLTHKSKTCAGVDEKVLGALSPLLRNYLCYEKDYSVINCTLEQQERIIGYVENIEPDHRQYIVPCYDGPILVWENFGRNADFKAMNKYVSETLKTPNCTFDFKVEPIEIDESVVPEFIEDEFSSENVYKEKEEEDDRFSDPTYLAWKNEFEKTVCQIHFPISYLIKTNYGNELVSEDHLIKSKKEHFNQITKRWLFDPNRKSYHHMEFMPGVEETDTPKDIYNTFTGFNIPKGPFEESEPEQTLKEKVKLFDELLDLVGNHEEKTVEYIKQWIAHIFQKPGEMPRTAIVLRGEHGVGKNTITECIKRLLGPSLYFETSDPINELFGRFSTHKEDKLCIVLNETEAKQTFSNNQKIKDMITNPLMNIESKGIKAYTKNSFLRSFSHTNNEIPLKIEQGDRRFMVSQCSSKRKGDKVYWKEFYAWLNKPESIRAIYDYLMSVELTLDFEADRPKTDAYYDIQEACLSVDLKWILNLVIDDFPKEFEKEVGNFELFQNYKGTLPPNYDTSIVKFGKMLKKLDIPGFTKVRSKFGVKWNIDRNLAFKWLQEKNYTREKVLPDTVEIEFIED